LAQILMVSC